MKKGTEHSRLLEVPEGLWREEEGWMLGDCVRHARGEGKDARERLRLRGRRGANEHSHAYHVAGRYGTVDGKEWYVDHDDRRVRAGRIEEGGRPEVAEGGRSK